MSGNDGNAEVVIRKYQHLADLFPGKHFRFRDRYEWHDLIDQGGLSYVVGVKDHGEGHARRALKVSMPESATNPEGLARLRRESEIGPRLYEKNPWIFPKFYDSGEDAGEWGCVWLVMERLSGRNIADFLDDIPGHRLELGEFFYIAHAACTALSLMHEENILHRDVKPANFYLTVDGRVVMLDFGVSRDTRDGSRLTVQGTKIGTEAYMAPEQAMGKTEARSDAYSLGLMFHELLTGERPVMGSARATAEVYTHEDSALRYSLAGVIDRARHREIDRRFGTVNELWEALVAVADRFGIVEACPVLDAIHADIGRAPTALPPSTPSGMVRSPRSSAPGVAPRPATPLSAAIPPTIKPHRGGSRIGLVMLAALVVAAILVIPNLAEWSAPTRKPASVVSVAKIGKPEPQRSPATKVQKRKTTVATPAQVPVHAPTQAPSAPRPETVPIAEPVDSFQCPARLGGGDRGSLFLEALRLASGSLERRARLCCIVRHGDLGTLGASRALLGTGKRPTLQAAREACGITR